MSHHHTHYVTSSCILCHINASPVCMNMTHTYSATAASERVGGRERASARESEQETESERQRARECVRFLKSLSCMGMGTLFVWVCHPICMGLGVGALIFCGAKLRTRDLEMPLQSLSLSLSLSVGVFPWITMSCRLGTCAILR